MIMHLVHLSKMKHEAHKRVRFTPIGLLQQIACWRQERLHCVLMMAVAHEVEDSAQEEEAEVDKAGGQDDAARAASPCNDELAVQLVRGPDAIITSNYQIECVGSSSASI